MIATHHDFGGAGHLDVGLRVKGANGNDLQGFLPGYDVTPSPLGLHSTGQGADLGDGCGR